MTLRSLELQVACDLLWFAYRYGMVDNDLAETLPVPRYWCRPTSAFHVDPRGYLLDPETSAPFGQSSNPSVVATGRLADEQCLVLLGEPGSGKTTTLTAGISLLISSESANVVHDDLGTASDDDITALLRAVADRLDAGQHVALVLDGFDEAHERLPLLPYKLARWLTGIEPERLSIRLACRTARWPSSLEEALRVSFGDVGVYELLPLRREDVARVAASSCEADDFLIAVEQAGAVPLATRPLTLQMLVRSFARDGQLPDNMAALYSIGVRWMCDEQNRTRRTVGLAGALSADDRAAVVSRLAALTFFGENPAVSPGWLANAADGDLVVDDAGGGEEPTTGGSVTVTGAAVREALQTSLFTSRGGERLGWTHATFQDFLTARWIAANGLQEPQIRLLLVADDGLIFPQAREVAGWLVALDPLTHGWLTDLDPAAFLNGVAIPDHDLRARIVDGLLETAQDAGLVPQWQARYQTLCHPQLADQIRPHLHSGVDDVRAMAMDLAKDCDTSSLRPDLVVIALDEQRPARDRSDACWALARMSGVQPLTELRKIALGEVGDDPDDDVRGAALIATWPHAVTTEDVLATLTSPKRKDLLGAYAIAISDIAAALTPADLPAALKWLRAHADDSDHRFTLITNAAIRLACASSTSDAVEVLADMVLRRASQYRQLLGASFTDGPDPFEDPSIRRRIADVVFRRIPDDATAVTLVDRGPHGPQLLREGDLDWLVDRYRDNAAERQPLGAAFSWMYRHDLPEHRETLFSLKPGHPLYDDIVGAMVAPIELDSEHADQLRTQWRRRNQGRQEPINDDINDRIKELLDDFEKGNVDAFWKLSRLLSVPPGSKRSNDDYKTHITTLRRWESLDEETQRRIVDAARVYLEAGGSNPDCWLGQPVTYWPAEAAYRALVLVDDADPASLDELSADAWREWAPVVVTKTVTSNGGSHETKARLIERAMPHAMEELQNALFAHVASAANRNEHVLVRRELDAVWSDGLAARLLTLAQQAQDPPLADILDALAINSPSLVDPLLATWLEADAVTNNPERAVLVGGLVIANPGPVSWPALRAVLDQDVALARQIIESYAMFAAPVPPLSEGELADLWLWLFTQYPPTEDPNIEGTHAVGPREALGEWRNRILVHLRDLGTPEAVDAMRRITATLPAESWLTHTHTTAKEALRRSQWLRIPPAQLRALAADRRTRLVRTGGDLLEATVESLRSLQNDLQGEHRAAQFLWDTTAHVPKSEDEASDFVAHHLRRDIADQGIIANREVQVRRFVKSGIGQRSDIRVEAHADPASGQPTTITVPVEAKLAWNRDVDTAMEDQLLRRYMQPSNSRHGVLLVFWFEPGHFWADTREKHAVEQLDRAALFLRLEQQAQRIADHEGAHIEVVILDASWRTDQ